MLGVDALGPRRDGSGRGGRVLQRRAASSIGTNTCTPLAPLVLTAPASPTSASAWRTRWAAPHGHRERVRVRRVEVEHQVRHAVGTLDAHEGRVVLDGALVGEPQQRAAVVAQRVGHVPLRRLGPQLHRAHPRRRVLRDVLLHEGFLAAVDPDHRQRPVFEHGKDPVAHRVQVVHQVPLGRVGAVEQRLVEVGQRHPVPLFTTVLGAHRPRR